MAIRALVFDAYGTLYDVHSIYEKTEELCPRKGDLITNIWRLKQLEYSWLQTALEDYRDFAILTHASLDFALRAVGIEPRESLTRPLFEQYLDLDPFPDAADALATLKNLGRYKLAILSNGSEGMLAALVRNSGFESYLDAVISVDGARKFKPHPDCYRLVERVLGVRNDEVMFVSSNGFDVTGAKHFGFNVTCVRRDSGPVIASEPVTPAQMYRLLRGNAESLGFFQDHTVSALTELPNLLAHL